MCESPHRHLSMQRKRSLQLNVMRRLFFLSYTHSRFLFEYLTVWNMTPAFSQFRNNFHSLPSSKEATHQFNFNERHQLSQRKKKNKLKTSNFAKVDSICKIDIMSPTACAANFFFHSILLHYGQEFGKSPAFVLVSIHVLLCANVTPDWRRRV